MKQRKTIRLGTLACLVLILALVAGPGWSQNQPPSQFPMKPVDVCTLNPSVKAMILSGSAQLCQGTPNPAVKTQATTQSKTALHGTVKINGNPLVPSEGTPVYYTLDHSQGKENEYDTLYIDLNQDLDLSNDTPVSLDSDFPEADLKLLGNKAVVFNPVEFNKDNTPFSARLILRQLSDTLTIATFSPTQAMQGKVTIGDKEHDMIITQINALSANFNHVWTACFMDGQRNGSTGLLADWPTEGGVLYQLTANTDGSQVTVQPYTGGFGTLNLTTKQGKKVKVNDQGYLLSKSRLINLSQCPKKNGVPEIPVGEYMPVNLSTEVGGVQLSIRFKPDPDQTVTNPYSLKIRNGSSEKMTIPAMKDVAFTWTNSKKEFKAGESVRISAAVGDTDTGLSIGGISNKDGESIPPSVTILDAKGKVVTQGKMPFG